MRFDGSDYCSSYERYHWYSVEWVISLSLCSEFYERKSRQIVYSKRMKRTPIQTCAFRRRRKGGSAQQTGLDLTRMYVSYETPPFSPCMNRRLTNVSPHIFLTQLNAKLIHLICCRELKSGEKLIGLNATYAIRWWCYDDQKTPCT